MLRSIASAVARLVNSPASLHCPSGSSTCRCGVKPIRIGEFMAALDLALETAADRAGA